MKRVNPKGVSHAKFLIAQGKIDFDSDWEFTAEDGNAILGDDNWDEYEKWFLCIDTDEPEQTKARYKYPYGKNGKVYRRGVIAAKQRASQQNDTNIAKVADTLLQLIDKKETNFEETSMIKKVFKGEIKSISDSDFIIESVVSDETVDRYNEVILASAWKKGLDAYRAHPVLLSSHNYEELTSQIGEVVDIKVKGKQLISKMKYYVGEGNEQADWGYKLAKKGIAAFSVGFIAKDVTVDPEEIVQLLGLPEKAKIPSKVYKDVELLEISQVLIPANPSALAKAMDTVADPIIKSIYELGRDMFEEMNSEPQLTLNDIFSKLIELEKKISSLDANVSNVIRMLNFLEDNINVRMNKKVDAEVGSPELQMLLNEIRTFTGLLK